MSRISLVEEIRSRWKRGQAHEAIHLELRESFGDENVEGVLRTFPQRDAWREAQPFTRLFTYALAALIVFRGVWIVFDTLTIGNILPTPSKVFFETFGGYLLHGLGGFGSFSYIQVVGFVLFLVGVVVPALAFLYLEDGRSQAFHLGMSSIAFPFIVFSSISSSFTVLGRLNLLRVTDAILTGLVFAFAAYLSYKLHPPRRR